MEVRVRPLRRLGAQGVVAERRVECDHQIADGVPAHAGPVHPGVDRQVPTRTADRPPGHDVLDAVQRGREPGAERARQLGREQRREHHHAPPDPGRTKRLPLGDARHAVRPRLHRLERSRDGDRAEPVRVGLDHREDRAPRARSHLACVAHERTEIDIEPRALPFGVERQRGVTRRPRDRRADEARFGGHAGGRATERRARRAGEPRNLRDGAGAMQDDASRQAESTLEDTLALMRDLRRRCEWDRAQTHASLRPYLVEEAYEVDEAIAQAVAEPSPAADATLRDELGDLLSRSSSTRSSRRNGVPSGCTTWRTRSSRRCTRATRISIRPTASNPARGRAGRR
jgi:hypothetical protein